MILKESLNMPLGLFKLNQYIKRKIAFNRANPNYFKPSGLCVFVGAQGSGKTLSAVQYTLNILKKYPNCKLVTNIHINNFEIVSFKDYLDNLGLVLDLNNYDDLFNDYLKNNRVFAFNNNDDFSKYKNGSEGVVFLVDEVHLYLNSLESKNINLETVNLISQQRKNRVHIVSTCQVFGRLAKPLREQFSCVVICKCLFNCFQLNKLIDRDSIEESTSDSKLKGKVQKRSLFFHSYNYYDCYDTYYTIDRTKFISQELKKGDIYGIELSNSD